MALKFSVPSTIDFDHSKFKSQVRKLLHTRSVWSGFLIEWHIRNLKVSRVSTPSIEDILVNVNKPWVPRGKCACNDIMHKLRGVRSA